MSVHVIIHIANEEPFQAEMEELPSAASTHIQVTNPRTREGRPVAWSGKGTIGYLFPWSRILFIEIAVHGQEKDVVGFIRDTTRS